MAAPRATSCSAIAASAALSCPLPPSITTRSGNAANDGSSSVPLASRANRREIASDIDAKSSGPPFRSMPKMR